MPCPAAQLHAVRRKRAHPTVRVAWVQQQLRARAQAQASTSATTTAGADGAVGNLLRTAQERLKDARQLLESEEVKFGVCKRLRLDGADELQVRLGSVKQEERRSAPCSS